MVDYIRQAYFTNWVPRNFADILARHKATNTAHLLLKTARLLNEYALATLEVDGLRPRPAHMALYPHIALEGTRVSELSRALGISKQAVSQLVDDLEDMAVVERRPDPADGRAKLVVFTERGRQGMLEGLAHLKAIEHELACWIGDDTVDRLHHGLTLVGAALDALRAQNARD